MRRRAFAGRIGTPCFQLFPDQHDQGAVSTLLRPGSLLRRSLILRRDRIPGRRMPCHAILCCRHSFRINSRSSFGGIRASGTTGWFMVVDPWPEGWSEAARLIRRSVPESDRLPDLDFIKHAIGVFVAPSEVSPLLVGLRSAELPIILVLLAQVDTISTIFLGVVYVIVAAIPIVVTLIVVVVRGGERNKERGAQKESAENEKTFHM